MGRSTLTGRTGTSGCKATATVGRSFITTAPATAATTFSRHHRRPVAATGQFHPSNLPRPHPNHNGIWAVCLRSRHLDSLSRKVNDVYDPDKRPVQCAVYGWMLRVRVRYGQ